MFLHLAHMLSGRGMRRMLWVVPLLLPTFVIRHPYAPFLLFQWVFTPTHIMPPNEVPRTLRTIFAHLLRVLFLFTSSLGASEFSRMPEPWFPRMKRQSTLSVP